MNIKKLGLFLPLVLMLLGGVSSATQADIRSLGTKKAIGVRLSNADPAIISITAASCACDKVFSLSVVDTLVMQGVKVKIFNHGTTTARIKLKYSYFDLSLGRQVTRDVTWNNLNLGQGLAIPGRKYATVWVEKYKTILAKRGVGVTVEIIPVTPDKNLANNKQTVRRCDTHIVE